MKTMWKLVFLILCTNYFTLGLHIRKRSSDYDNQVELSEQCEEDKDCITEHSFCNVNDFFSICACKVGFEEKNKECAEKPKVGTKCESDATCSSLTDSSCVEAACACKEGFVPSVEKDSCLKKATEVNGECKIQEQCASIANSTCKSNKCVLPKDHGEACEETSDCKSGKNLECKDKICECLENYVETDKTCVKKAENVGDPCTVEGQCSPISATCKENKCEALTTIAPPVAPPQNENYCSESVNCTKENTICEENSCRCKDGFVTSDNTKECLKEAEKLGDNCTENVQCTVVRNATCQNNICSEKQTERLVQQAMAAGIKVNIGGSCVKDECQHIQNSICKESVCQCTDEYVTSINETQCLKKAKSEGENCEIDKQCEGIAGASCSGNKCVKPAVQQKVLEKGSDDNQDNKNSATSLKLTGVISSIMIIGILQLI